MNVFLLFVVVLCLFMAIFHFFCFCFRSVFGHFVSSVAHFVSFHDFWGPCAYLFGHFAAFNRDL